MPKNKEVKIDVWIERFSQNLEAGVYQANTDIDEIKNEPLTQRQLVRLSDLFKLPSTPQNLTVAYQMLNGEPGRLNYTFFDEQGFYQGLAAEDLASVEPPSPEPSGPPPEIYTVSESEGHTFFSKPVTLPPIRLDNSAAAEAESSDTKTCPKIKT